LVDSTPSPSTLGTHQSAQMFLNNKLETFDAIASDYSAKSSSLGYYAYVHIVNSSTGTVIQYWLFYAYNNGQLNDHQSDVEVVEIFLDSTGTPIQALYSQHLAGENAAWGDVETQNGHPVVYVALGSHANYFRPYQGKIGIENDVVNSNGPTISPQQLNLVVLYDGLMRPPSQSWLSFPGRWGYVGTETEVATGMAGPYGPVYNDNGQRWADPSGYLSRTLTVGGYYLDLAWVAANFLLLFVLYVIVRGAWKGFGIYRLLRSGGLRVGKFLKGKGGLALGVGLLGIVIMVAALALPWYSVTATSQTGPLSGSGPVQLMSIDGVNGLSVNLFTGPNADSSSGLAPFASAQFPFAIVIGVGLVLLLLDIIGVKSGKSLGRKFMLGAIASIIPFILIYVFIVYLPNLIPLASGLLGNQPIPTGVNQLVSAMASNPISGSASQTFPVVGNTSVTWGFGIGAYLFLAAAVVRVFAGMMMRRARDLTPAVTQTPPPAVTTLSKPAA
jgi:hypothetical protein